MGELLVSMKGISKRFPGVKALDAVNMDLYAGEVRALLGENGAGKSTLMKILSGVIAQDEGEIEILGKKTGRDYCTARAQDLGVAIIHQELNMCRHLSVAENMFLGRELSGRGRLDNREMERLSREQLSALGASDLDPRAEIGSLSVGRQQLVEIARALMFDARVLIMDEPSSALSHAEVTELFRVVKELRERGKAIVYISHRLEELSHIADTVSVMRDGKYICGGKFSDFTMDELIAHMVGREIHTQFPRLTVPRGRPLLEVRHLRAGTQVQDVSFTVHAGEALGIAGLVGAGRTETCRLIFGADPKEDGQILIDGKAVHIGSPRDALQSGIALIPEDRKRDGLCARLSVRENIALPNLDELCTGGFLGRINREREQSLTESSRRSLTIKMASAEMEAGSLSGGNQQKIVVAKWLAAHARVIMFDEPTRGIDVAAKVEIYDIINELKRQGAAVIVVSSEMSEVLGISDRIAVMCEGRITGEFEADEASEEAILSCAMRFKDKLVCEQITA